jgi:GR25 family glycosyltransferase involved in LPS biosynthesis
MRSYVVLALLLSIAIVGAALLADRARPRRPGAVATHAVAAALPSMRVTPRTRHEVCGGGFSHPETLLPGPEPERAFCISLSYRENKWGRVRESLAAQGIEAERLTAVVGSQLWPGDYDERVISERFRKHVEDKPGHIGHLGCSLSHSTLYRTVVDDRVDGPVLVVEDDATFGPEFRAQLADRLARVGKVDPAWDVLLLGFSCGYNSYDKCHENDNAEILGGGCLMQVRRFMGTWGYVINGRRAAARILEGLFPHGWAIDHHMCDMAAKDKLKLYGCVPTIAFHPGEFAISSAGYVKVEPYSNYVSDTNS